VNLASGIGGISRDAEDDAFAAFRVIILLRSPLLNIAEFSQFSFRDFLGARGAQFNCLACLEKLQKTIELG
jgi:hypothetical protein